MADIDLGWTYVGKWAHTAVVYVDGRYTLYIDGENVGEWRHDGSDPLTIEIRNGRDIATFGEALLPEDVLRHYSQAVLSDSPKAYWPLGEEPRRCQCNLINHAYRRSPIDLASSSDCLNDAEPGSTTCRECWSCVP